MDLLGTMEANRDAAMSCRENARAALGIGDTKQARRFIDKAQQLYPCDEEDHELLARVEEAAVMLKDVERICNACNYYEVLEVQSAASTEEIRRAFKLQSLKVHPDKNHMPRAADAFKKLNASHEVLTDPVERGRYDLGWHTFASRYSDSDNAEDSRPFQRSANRDTCSSNSDGDAPSSPRKPCHSFTRREYGAKTVRRRVQKFCADFNWILLGLVVVMVASTMYQISLYKWSPKLKMHIFRL
ncbi:dnaJ homolog subfamily B member 14-like isoform X2 [Lethenteron reissneri]|uniref:dnaJ homolog subfamily B member 14-like isoform X2 n=1 Tax=Lethenteron reissneri TaxID=7753 RepID=UPI002AB66728|nr:dnaJ homolog subfamily B member 14-like isoform X2 [Lethenteron reissneri]